MKLKSGKVIGILFGIALMIGLMAPAAFAVDFELQINGGTPISLTSLTPSADVTHDYSSYNCKGSGSYKYYTAEGENLVDMIDEALDYYQNGLYSSADVDYVEFIGSDGYDTDDYGTITMGDLNGYYYATPSTSPGTAVEPIIATRYCSPRVSDGGSLSPTDCPRNFHGQPGSTGGAGADVMQMWVKGLDTVVVKVNP